MITVITATIPRNITTNPAKPLRSIIFAATAKPITATDSNPKVVTIIRARSPIDVPVSCIVFIITEIASNVAANPASATPIPISGPAIPPVILFRILSAPTTTKIPRAINPNIPT